MEGIVAKRTLKKSYYENNMPKYIENIGAINKQKEKSRVTLKEKILFKISIQLITMIGITVFVLAIKYLNIDVVAKSEFANKIKQEFKTSYTIEQILEKTNEIYKLSLVYIKPIVPDNIENKLNGVIKKILPNGNFEKEKQEVKVYEENNNSKSEDKEENKIECQNTSVTNIGGSVDEENAVVSVASSISTETEIAKNIKETKIKFKLPVVGTVTSSFGAREEIFEGIDSYHTGIDIGANMGTKVVSSIPGKVTVATYNKYNGNYIEITNGKIVTKYCHLSKINVKVGDEIKSGKKIGEVGSTGLSTGPHLHFEIVYDGVKINPELILDF